MPRQLMSSRAVRRPRTAAMLLAALSGLALAALTGIAIAKSFTVKTAKGVKVTNLMTHVTKTETIVVNSRGLSVYTLSGETTHHFKCKTATCVGFWPPVKVARNAKLTKGPGVNGKLGKVHRNGFFQVTINGHPIYTFSTDAGRRGVAMGEGVMSFGGTWHVVKGSSPAAAGAPAPAAPAPAAGMPPGYPVY
jgi:predicted lipoprotein with Yx(FWY)xxD motif